MLGLESILLEVFANLSVINKKVHVLTKSKHPNKHEPTS